MAGRIKAPKDRCPDVPDSLNAVVMKAMALAPEDRYQSVADLIADVRAFLDGYSPLAHESSGWTEFSLFYQRNRNSCNVAAVFLLVVVAVTAFFFDRLSARRVEAENLATRLQVEKEETQSLANRLQAEKDESELLTERLQAERQETENLAERLRLEMQESEVLLRQAVEQADSIFFDAPLVSHKLSVRSLNDTIHNQPEDSRNERIQLGYLYFISAEFAKAQTYFANAERITGPMRLNDELVKIFDPVKHQTSADQITTIVSKLVAMNRSRMAFKLLAYDHASLGYRPGYESAVRVIYRGAGDFFKFDPKSNSLTVDGKGRLDSLSGRNGEFFPLQLLPVKRLILVNTRLRSTTGLAGLTMLETADIRGSEITSVAGLQKLPELKSLTVRPNQLSAEERALLPPRIKIHEQR